MISIALNFINNSNDTNPNGVVIFQQNVATASGAMEAPIAWMVFQNVGRGDNHPFQIPMNMMVSASDSFGNFTPQMLATNGSRFDMTSSVMGNQLVLNSKPASGPEVVEVYNDLPAGSINTSVYKNGFVLAKKTGVAPGQKAAFAFQPTIYLTLNSQLVQGEIMDIAKLADNQTQISLLGIRSADIVLTGGGSGTDAQPYLFTLQNVMMA